MQKLAARRLIRPVAVRHTGPKVVTIRKKA